MGNGASSPHHAASEPPSTPSCSAAASVTSVPRAKRMLVNAAPRSTTGSFRSPAATMAASMKRQQREQSPDVKLAALQLAATQRRQRIQQMNSTSGTAGSDDSLLAFTRGADPISLRVLELLQQVDDVPLHNPAEKLRLLRNCYPLLEKVPSNRFDQLAVTVHQKEGDVYYHEGDTENAKSTYSRAITLAEKRVAREETDMYMVLKRYVLAMIGMARIWYHHERDHQGFTFTDQRQPKMRAAVGGEGSALNSRSSSIGSLEGSILTDSGSVFSLNEEILKSMAPRQPRRQTGPLFQRVKLKAPHVTPNSQYTREEEFVLHSRMTRELVASPCELLLLRCCEVVQIGHNAQSELLIPALIELAQIYEDLSLYSRALLLVRRCLGILCSVFDYDHPWVVQLMQRVHRLEKLLAEQTRNNMATKIQATWRMYAAMQQLEDALGHSVRRHRWIPRKYRTVPDLDFLGDYVGDMPVGEGRNDGDDDDDYGNLEDGADIVVENDDPNEWPRDDGNDVGLDEGSLTPSETSGHHADVPNGPPPRSGTVVCYAPVEGVDGGDTFTTMLTNAAVVGTTQDTQTDTDVRHTEYGDVLTVRTTTITRTVTEDLGSDGDGDGDDDNDSSDDEEEKEEEEEEELRSTGSATGVLQHPQPLRPAPTLPHGLPPPSYNKDKEEKNDGGDDDEDAEEEGEGASPREYHSVPAPPRPPPRTSSPLHEVSGVTRAPAPQLPMATRQPPPPPPQASYEVTPEWRATNAGESDSAKDVNTSLKGRIFRLQNSQLEEPPIPATARPHPPLRTHPEGGTSDAASHLIIQREVYSTASSERQSRRGSSGAVETAEDTSSEIVHEETAYVHVSHQRTAVAPARPSEATGQRDARREPLHNTVDPRIAYPTESNVCPPFLPPLRNRHGGGTERWRQPPPQTDSNGHSAHRRSSQGSSSISSSLRKESVQHGLTGYHHHHDGGESGSSGSSSSHSNTSTSASHHSHPPGEGVLPPQVITTTTRNYKMNETRTEHTYTQGQHQHRSSSNDGGGGDGKGANGRAEGRASTASWVARPSAASSSVKESSKPLQYSESGTSSLRSDVLPSPKGASRVPKASHATEVPSSPSRSGKR